MADRSARYWDFREAAWVRYVAPEPADDVLVPAQPSVAADPVVDAAEADVRSG